MNLVNFWEKKVAKGHKHFANELSSVKKRRLKNRFKKHALDQIPMSKIKLCMDWGCGGGLLAKMIPESSKIIFVDISKESLERAKNYTGRVNAASLHVSDPATMHISGDKPDLLWCYSVIHHMPNLDHWKATAKLWKEMAPKWISVSTKVAKKTQTCGNYVSDYYSALVLSKKDFIGPFDEYDLKYYQIEKMPASWNLAFAILRRK